MSAAQIASEYRAESGMRGGYVVVHEGEPSGWTRELDKPKSWMPGCIAIDEQEKQWKARGGNNYDGSDRWVALDKAS